MTQLPDVVIPAVRVTEGTYPAGSQWTRNPIPACQLCDVAMCNFTDKLEQEHCVASCSGFNVTGRSCPPKLVQFPAPADGLSGGYAPNCILMGGGRPKFIPADFELCDTLAGFEFNIVDKVCSHSVLPAPSYARLSSNMDHVLAQALANLQLLPDRDFIYTHHLYRLIIVTHSLHLNLVAGGGTHVTLSWRLLAVVAMG